MAQSNPSGPAPKSGPPAPRRDKKKTPAHVIVGRVVKWFLLTLFTLAVIGVLTCAIFFKIFMTYIDTTLVPSLGGTLNAQELTLSLTSTIYDKNGKEILKLYDNSEKQGGNRELIKYDDLPEHLIQALVAIEDKRFWTHQGVDWYGTLGAIKSTVTGGATRGGSTLTQQVLRNMYDDTEVTVKRKLREIFRALEFEKDPNVTKEYIITEYLNRVFFGQSYYGIQTAAKGYFGKDVSELTLAESAAIIGITNNPSLYDPFRDAKFKQEDGSYKTCREFNKSRQELILDQMCEQGYIDEAARDAAKAEKLLFTDTDEYRIAHGLTVAPQEGEDEGSEEETFTGESYTWFEDAAINEAITLIQAERGVSRETASTLLYNSGYHIYTTLDPDIQAIVDEVYEDPANFDYPSPSGKPLDSAITVVDPYTGDVVAMAGGVGVKTGRRGLNLATSPRTPGSALKPVAVYAPALEYDVISPGTVWDDYPLRLNSAQTGGYPKNDPVGYKGYTTVASGLQRSVNTIASRSLEAMGYSRSYEFMTRNLGFTTLDVRDLALSPLGMGGLTYGVTTTEMAAAYGAFVNRGTYSRPRMVTRIESYDHSEVIVDNPVRSNTAMKESTAYLMIKMLRSVMSSPGTGARYRFDGMSMAGKTGTTNDKYDRYFAGFTPYYSAAVWVGYKDKAERIDSGRVNPAAAAWQMVMEKIHEGLEDKSFFDNPGGISSVQVCADCGKLPTALCAADYRGSRVITVDCQTSALPTEECTCHVEVQVCVNPETGEARLAGEFCPEDTVQTRVMLEGREFLGLPGYEVTLEDGTVTTSRPIESDDMAAHLTYLKTLGLCPYHDENFDPEAQLPGEGEEGDPPQPGEDGQWPTTPWDPNPGEPADPTEPSNPGTTEPSGGGTTPGEPSGGGTTPGEPDGGGQPPEPDEPDLPAEPELP